VLLLLLLDLLLLAGLALPGRVRKLTETTWAAKLVAGCEMDFVTSVGAVALACPGVDYMRRWPLPVVQPWQETPDPIDGWMAKRLSPAVGCGGVGRGSAGAV
jgi:hypothetical protein